MILDDESNLRGYFSWLRGETGWLDVVLGNASGPTGRPLSMASFVLNGAVAGASIAALKAGNLVLHLASGVLLALLLARILARRLPGGTNTTAVALVATAFWLLAPAQTSTVFYVVQRMTLLSTVFVLFAVIAYLGFRDAPGLRGRLGFFVIPPLLFLLGVLSKENAVVAPALCLVVEMACFDRMDTRQRLFFASFLVAPALLVALAFALSPERILWGYWLRDFTPYERVLTQGRALWSYVDAFALPRGGNLGIYTDDFAISRSWLSPWTTLAAWLGWLAVACVAIAWRRRDPLLFCGVFWFLAAHALEASIVPLELYFDHRNHLPSVGLVLVGLALWNRVRRHPSFRRIGPIAIGAVLLAFALASVARGYAWQDSRALVQLALSAHPDSLRARLDHIALLVDANRRDDALAALAPLRESDRPGHRALSVFTEAGIRCRFDRHAPTGTVGRLESLVGSRIHYPVLVGLEGLAPMIEAGCAGIEADALADWALRMVDASDQPESLVTMWKMRYLAASLYEHAGRRADAYRQAKRAWDSGRADLPVGGYAAELAIASGRCDDARALVDALARRVAAHRRRDHVHVARLRALVGARCGSTRPPAPRA